MKTKLLKKLRKKFRNKYRVRVLNLPTPTYVLCYEYRLWVYSSTSLDDVEQRLKHEIRDDICSYIRRNTRNVRNMQARAEELNKKYFW